MDLISIELVSLIFNRGVLFELPFVKVTATFTLFSNTKLLFVAASLLEVSIAVPLVAE